MAQFKSTMRISAMPKSRNLNVDLLENSVEPTFEICRGCESSRPEAFRSEILGKDDGK